VPVRVQHRSGVLWTLNSAGLAAVGLPGHPDGRLRSADRSWSDALQRRDTVLDELSRRLCSYGVTGITDATPDLGIVDIVKLEELHRTVNCDNGCTTWRRASGSCTTTAWTLSELTRWIAARHREQVSVALHCVTAAQLILSMAALRTAGPARR
jgi:hypothetical protein